MSLYPIKLLKDENQIAFIPFVTSNAVLINGTDKTVSDMFTDIYTKEEIDNIIRSLGTLQRLCGRVNSIEDLPDNPKPGDTYIVGPEGKDAAEYMYIGDSWERLGNMVDLSGYYTSDDVDELMQAQKAILQTQITEEDAATLATAKSYTDSEIAKIPKTDLSNYYNKEEVDEIASTIEGHIPSVVDFVTKDELPTNVSDLTNDVGYITALEEKSYTLQEGTEDGTIQIVGTNGETSQASVKGLGANAYNSTNIPTKTSDLTNDSGFIAGIPKASSSALGGIKVGTGLSIDATGLLSVTGGGVADAVEWTNVLNKPEFSEVATSGDYNDLLNTPTIPDPVIVDSTLDKESTNAIENKAVTTAIDSLNEALEELPEGILESVETLLNSKNYSIIETLDRTETLALDVTALDKGLYLLKDKDSSHTSYKSSIPYRYNKAGTIYNTSFTVTYNGSSTLASPYYMFVKTEDCSDISTDCIGQIFGYFIIPVKEQSSSSSTVPYALLIKDVYNNNMGAFTGMAINMNLASASRVETVASIVNSLQTASHTHTNKALLDGITQDDINNWNDKQDEITSTNKLDYSLIANGPTKTSDLENDSNFMNSMDTYNMIRGNMNEWTLFNNGIDSADPPSFYRIGELLICMGKVAWGSCAANNNVSAYVTFPEEFGSVPYCFCCLQNATTNTNYGNVAVKMVSQTTTGATLQVVNKATAAVSPAVSWLAIGAVKHE